MKYYIMYFNGNIEKEFDPAYDNVIAFEDYMMRAVEFDSVDSAVDYAKKQVKAPCIIVKDINQAQIFVVNEIEAL